MNTNGRSPSMRPVSSNQTFQRRVGAEHASPIGASGARQPRLNASVSPSD